MADVRSAILNNVQYVKQLGSPGSVVVHAKDAVAVFTNKQAEVIIGASAVSSGRAVIFTHDAYTHLFLTSSPSSNQQLVANIKSWVTKGQVVSQSNIHNVDSYSDFDKIPTSAKILVWIGMGEKSAIFYQKLQAWISNGGGFVGGATPWGYLSLYPNKSLFDLPLNAVMEKMGMRYTSNIISSSGNLFVSDNNADNSNVNDAIRVGIDRITNLAIYGTNIENAITFLSDQELNGLLPSIKLLIDQHKNSVNCIPTKQKPVRSDEGRSLASLINRILLRTGEYDGQAIAPGIKDFPGTFPTPPPLTTATVSARSGSHPSRTFSTGYYLPPGQEIIVTRSSLPGGDWKLMVGSHTDALYDKHVVWRRWPKVNITKKITDSPLRFHSPFGGCVYLMSPQDSSQSITVQLQNVTLTPAFSPGQGGQWETVKKYPGLWADMSGEKIMITLPASSVRALPDPTNTMKLWDQVVSLHYDLRGVDPYRGRGQRVVTDEQPSAGYMHAGYPVVTGLDVANPDKTGDDGFLLNSELLHTVGMWGMFHELGHNMQDSQWTFSGTGEVTCNIFTLHAMEVITGQKPWTHPWVRGQYGRMRSYLLSGANFADWRRKAGVALGIYAQLARDIGWATYKAVFSEYNNLPGGKRPRTDDQKIDQWIVRFSKKAGRNLLPMFDFWGFPIRSNVITEVKGLPVSFHHDESTQTWAPSRAAMIRQKYGILANDEEDDVKEIGGDCDYMEQNE